MSALLDAGAPVNADTQGRWDCCTLSIAAREGHERVVKRLLDRGAHINGHAEDCTHNPLAEAANRRQEATVKLLIDNGADMNGSGRTENLNPLLAAISSQFRTEDDRRIIGLLLEHGADPNIPCSPSGDSMLHVLVKSCLNQPEGIKEWYLDYAESQLPLELRGRESIFLALEKGAKPNALDANGKTPLWWAVSRESETMMRLLLDNGADPNIYPVDKLRPISLAVLNGNDTKVRLLLAAGADPEIVGDVDLTPLSMAALSGHMLIEQLLLEKGECATENMGNTRDALPLGITKKDFTLVKWLLSCGVDPNLKSTDGQAPLMLAVRMLGQRGANVNALDSEGRTAISRAASLEVSLNILDALSETKSDLKLGD